MNKIVKKGIMVIFTLAFMIFNLNGSAFAADTTKPLLAISAATPKSINTGGTVVYTVSASDEDQLTWFSIYNSDITLNGFTANISVQTTNTWTRTITLTNIVSNSSSTNKYITIQAGVTGDLAGNENTAKTSPAFTIAQDTQAPAMSISAASDTSVYASGTTSYTVSVSDDVGLTSYALSASDITLNGFTATVGISGSGNTRTVTLSNVQGTVGTSKYITVKAGVARDAAGNTTIAKSSPSFAILAVQDTTPPSITISAASDTSVYASGTTSYTVSVSDDVGITSYNLIASNITLHGFTATVNISGTGNTRTVTLSNIQGTVATGKYITVASGVARDAAGNTTPSKSSPSFAIIAPQDTQAPVIAISAASNASVYAAGTTSYTVSVSDDVGITAYTLSASDITLHGFTATVNISGTGNTRTVTLSNIQGTVASGKYITVAAGVARDAAGNTTLVKSSPSFAIIKDPDTTPPTIGIAGPSVGSVYAGGTNSYTITFADNEGIASVNLNSSYITLHGFTATINISGTGNTRTLTLTNIQGSVGPNKFVTVSAGAATDTSGNNTPAISSAAFSIIKNPDTTPPTITITGPSDTTIYSAGTVSYRVNFADNEGIASVNLNASDITLHGFTANISITGTGTSTRIITLTNIRGTIGTGKYISVASGAATDTSGNITPSISSNSFAIIKDPDTTPPTIIIEGPNPNRIYAGETVVYTVAFMDNEGIASINLSASNIKLNGFTANISVSGSGNTRTVTLTNVRGAIGANKSITVARGVATDTSGNVTPERTSESFEIIQDLDTTPPTISIIGPVPYSIYNGETVSYTVYFTDNEGIANINLNSGNITLHGFTANVSVSGTGNTRTVTLTNVQGAVGSGKYITIARGAATDTSGNVTEAKSSNSFTIMKKPDVISYAPVVTISAPNPSSIYSGEKITYTVYFTDDKAVTSVNLIASKITLIGFTADIAISGTGNSSRVVTLTNVKGNPGINKYIMIASGVALDAEGNRSQVAYSPRFTIKSQPVECVEPTKVITKSNGSCIDDLKLLGDINKEITYFASWLRAEKYTASYVQENNYVAENETMTYMVEYYNGSTAPTPNVNFELTIPYKVKVEEINAGGKVTKATEEETVIEWNMYNIPSFTYCRLYVRVKFLNNDTLKQSENISEIFYTKLKTTASGNTSYSYMRQLFIDITEGKLGTYMKYLTSIDSTNSIRPEDEITRAEFAKMLADSGILTVKPGSTDYKTFKDHESIPSYARDAVSALVGTDIIQAFADGTFKPNNPILVEDAMQMIAQASRYMSDTKLSVYKPVFIYTEALKGKDGLVSPKKDYIMELMRQNVIVKYESKPDTYALRKDVVSMINSLTFRGPYVETLPANTLKFADVREDSVYFYNIVGASNSYKYSYDYRLWQEIVEIKN